MEPLAELFAAKLRDEPFKLKFHRRSLLAKV